MQTANARELLDVAAQALRRLRREPLSTVVDDDALRDSVDELARLEAMVIAEKLRRVNEIDSRGAYIGRARSAEDYLAQRHGLTRGEAKVEASTARALERLPETAAKLADGELGVGHAREAARCLEALDDLVRQGMAVPDDADAGLDTLVADRGASEDRGQLRRSIDAWTHTHAPEALAVRERRAFAQRSAWMGTDNRVGAFKLEVQTDQLGGAHVRSALLPLARPTGPEDTRTFRQRLADAVVALAKGHLDGGKLPVVATQRPHVILVARADALHGLPDAEPAELDGVGPVSSATARQICCDAEITTVVVDDDDNPLYVGRTQRKPNRKQRLAAIARDRCCIKCGAAASRCQVHHVRYFKRDKGPTDIDNLCLLCWSCHHDVHHEGWRIVRTPNGGFTALAPSGAQRHSS